MARSAGIDGAVLTLHRVGVLSSEGRRARLLGFFSAFRGDPFVPPLESFTGFVVLLKTLDMCLCICVYAYACICMCVCAW